MSTFKVEVREIEAVWAHGNADRLDVACLKDLDYQFIVQKNNYVAGQLVVYFPIDSLLPSNLIERFDLVGKLSGPLKNRIKSIKLRGQLSQGFVSSLDALKDILGEVSVLDDVTTELGVEKYEPVISEIPGSTRVSTLPSTVPYYDLEGCERYKAIVESLLDEKVFITEKLEGSNYACGFDDRLKEDERYKDQEGKFVLSRRQSIIPVDDKSNSFWEVAKQQKFFELCERIKAHYEWFKFTNVYQVVLRGEIVGPGIQKNIYNLKQPKVFLFDIMVNDKYIDAIDFYVLQDKCAMDFKDQTVPSLSFNATLREWLVGSNIKTKSTGPSMLNPKQLREGIVIRPLVEADYPHFGRLILKQRSPEYLAGSDF